MLILRTGCQPQTLQRSSDPFCQGSEQDIEIVGESEGIPEILASRGVELPPEKPSTLDTGRFTPVWFQDLD